MSPTLSDRFAQLKVNTTSPDNTVAATWTARAGISITLDVDAMRRHTEQTLAAEIASAAYSAQLGFRRAVGAATPTDPASAASRAAELAGIDAKCVSPRGHVTARVRHDGRFDIAIRPGTLSGAVSREILTTELNAAIAATIRRHRFASTKLTRRKRSRTAAGDRVRNP